MAAQGLGHEGVEIISVDSALVYRGMDIGSAKPSPAERAAVAHHLIDIRDPLNAYSAAEFARDAQALVQDIRARGKFPLLVGGSMLYFKALMEGLSDMPAADPAVRLAIQEEAAQKGWPALHADLRRVDPVTAARLAPADSQRIARALEVFRLTGKPLSALHSPTKNSLESQLNWQPNASQFHVNVIVTDPSGGLPHVALGQSITNQQLQSNISMTTACAVNSITVSNLSVGAPSTPTCSAPLVTIQTGGDTSCKGGNTHTWPVGIPATDCHGWQSPDTVGREHNNSASNIQCNGDGTFSFVQYAGNLDCSARVL